MLAVVTAEDLVSGQVGFFCQKILVANLFLMFKLLPIIFIFTSCNDLPYSMHVCIDLNLVKTC